MAGACPHVLRLPRGSRRPSRDLRASNVVRMQRSRSLGTSDAALASTMPTQIQPAKAALSTLRLATLERKLQKEVARLELPPGPGPTEIVTDGDLAALPPVVARYLRFMGVAGRPRDWSFRMHFEGRCYFAGQWVPCRVAQFATNLSIARVRHMRLPASGLIPTYVRGTYARGHGHVVDRALDAFSMTDEHGDDAATGELVTYLNDALLFAPSMLLVPEVRWTAVDDTSFDVSLTDFGRTVTGRVYLTSQGVPTDFSSMDRYYVDPAKPKQPPMRTEWRTPVDGWRSFGGRACPTHVSALWMLEEGPFIYLEANIDPAAIAYDVEPGS
jgi:hypothetical protein